MTTTTALNSFSQKIGWSIKFRGIPATIMSCLAKIAKLDRFDWYLRFIDRQFDRRHGIDTGGMIPARQLDFPGDEWKRSYRYLPTQPVEFATLINTPAINFEDYTFVDYGSGKGRTLIMASAFPFKKIIGVDLSAKLCECASENVEKWLQSRAGQRAKCRCVEVRNDHAMQFELPPGPCVLYFFNPFHADVMAPVLDHIECSFGRSPRHLVLVYSNPVHRDLWDRASFLRQSALFDQKPEGAIYEAVP